MAALLAKSRSVGSATAAKMQTLGIEIGADRAFRQVSSWYYSVARKQDQRT